MLRIASSTVVAAGFDVEAAPGPFADNAREAHAAGLVVIPTAADDAKRPLVRWGRLERQPRLSTLSKWGNAFPNANLAYLPAPSGLAVVDVDDMAAEDRVRALLGLEHTPLIIQSGKRGLHLPLRADQPIPSLNLRRFGIVAEVKGARAIVVAPGSIHPDTGRLYRFVCGNWDEFTRLPSLDVQALEALIGRPIDGAEATPRSPTHRNTAGHRNAGTFAHLRALGAAGVFSSEREVVEAGHVYNAEHNDPPEPDSKVVATARQVWTYIERGTCRAKPAGRPGLTAREHATLCTLGRGYADGLALFLELKRAHTARVRRGETFAIAATAMAREPVIPGWSNAKRYLRAKRSLLACGLIEQARRHELQSWVGRDGKVRKRGMAPARYRFGLG